MLVSGRTIKEVVEPVANVVILHGRSRRKTAVTRDISLEDEWSKYLAEFPGDKGLFEGKRTCFPDTSGHLDWDSFNKRAPVPKRNWDPASA